MIEFNYNLHFDPAFQIKTFQKQDNHQREMYSQSKICLNKHILCKIAFAKIPNLTRHQMRDT